MKKRTKNVLAGCGSFAALVIIAAGVVLNGISNEISKEQDKALKDHPKPPATPHYPAEYRFVDLGKVYQEASPASINNRGYIVTDNRMCRINTAGRIVSVALNFTHWSTESSARFSKSDVLTLAGLNDKNDFIGTFDTHKVDAEGHQVTGGFVVIDHIVRCIRPFGDRSCYPVAINDSDAVVGSASTETIKYSTPVSHAFLYSLGRSRDIDPTPDPILKRSSDSRATSINDAGQIVGEAGFHAFLGQGRTTSFLPNCDNPAAINNKGIIVDRRGFWKAGVKKAKLAFPLGYDKGYEYSATAAAINDMNMAVGSGSYNGNRVQAESGVGWDKGIAVRWTFSKCVDLNSVVALPSGWALDTATGINNQGEIVGVGKVGGLWHAYLLIPLSKARKS